ncbi:hypothetical protein [Rubrivirga sp. IMCC43871]|uniref:hypothetical protein n=1 Tax=Rubrivirga sp. IMCC43871 TaxID=3391575 RepID=UPI00398FB1B8
MFNPDDRTDALYTRGEDDALNGYAFDAPADAEGEAAYREGYESVRLPGVTASDAPAYGPTLSPIEARAEAIAEDAALVLAHINAVGVTFDARKKVADAEEFSFLRGGSALAIPSKLSGVTAFQGDVSRLASALADLDALTPGAARSYPARLHKGTDAKGALVVVVMAETVPGDPVSLRALGMLADKHAAWIAPILGTVPNTGAVTEASTPIRVYVTAVTGGTPDRPTRGVNVAIHGAADAVRAFYCAAETEARQSAAYESGSRAAVEAATEAA